MVPAQVTSGHAWITVLTAMFMHVGWAHILGNMLFFWVFGPEIEDVMGPFRFLIFYLLSGLIATSAQIIINPTSTVPNLGASGAIAAVRVADELRLGHVGPLPQAGGESWKRVVSTAGR